MRGAGRKELKGKKEKDLLAGQRPSEPIPAAEPEEDSLTRSHSNNGDYSDANDSWSLQSEESEPKMEK